MGLITSSTSESAGISKQYTMQSLMDLYTLGGNLTQYTDTLESLKDYSPEKYDAKYYTSSTTDSTLSGGDTHTTTVYEGWDPAEVDARKNKMLPGLIARLGSIQTQKDKPGRNQLLGNQSLLG